MVFFDEGHSNHQTATTGRGMYKGLADVLVNDGYVVVFNKSRFTADTLKTNDILIISNALDMRNSPYRIKGKRPPFYSAFTCEEIDTIHEWVKEGGGLLLIADHWPFGSAVFDLAKTFGVIMSGGLTIDNYEHNFYTRMNGKLLEHSLTMGRNKDEKVNKIETFTGQSLRVPDGSGFMRFSIDAYNVNFSYEEKKDVGGQFAGAGFEYAKGRVVVIGEAGMFCVTKENRGMISDPSYYRGMNPEKNDNKKLLINIVHYLSGLLDPDVKQK